MDTPRILVVEDEPNIRRLIQVNLERQGYHVQTVGNDWQAWNVLQTEPFDLVIASPSMPEMGGEELEKRLQASETLCDLPVVLLTEKTAAGITEAVGRMLMKRSKRR